METIVLLSSQITELKTQNAEMAEMIRAGLADNNKLRNELDRIQRVNAELRKNKSYGKYHKIIKAIEQYVEMEVSSEIEEIEDCK
jgi:nitrogen-specific signal transduction histidine kinase